MKFEWQFFFQILDLLEGHPIFTLSGHSGAVNAVTFSPTGDAFASAGDDKLVIILLHITIYVRPERKTDAFIRTIGKIIINNIFTWRDFRIVKYWKALVT